MKQEIPDNIEKTESLLETEQKQKKSLEELISSLEKENEKIEALFPFIEVVTPKTEKQDNTADSKPVKGASDLKQPTNSPGKVEA